MPTLSWLNHGFIVVFLVFIWYLFIAEFAHSFLSFKFDLLIICLSSLSFLLIHEKFNIHFLDLRFVFFLNLGLLFLAGINHFNIPSDINWLICDYRKDLWEFLHFFWHCRRILLLTHVDDSCQDLSELAISPFLHKLAFKAVLANFKWCFEVFAAVTCKNIVVWWRLHVNRFKYLRVFIADKLVHIIIDAGIQSWHFWFSCSDLFFKMMLLVFNILEWVW